MFNFYFALYYDMFAFLLHYRLEHASLSLYVQYTFLTLLRAELQIA